MGAYTVHTEEGGGGGWGWTGAASAAVDLRLMSSVMGGEQSASAQQARAIFHQGWRDRVEGRVGGRGGGGGVNVVDVAFPLTGLSVSRWTTQGVVCDESNAAEFGDHSGGRVSPPQLPVAPSPCSRH
uniref:Uncharacterized protein n=1 Tax=Knipowitschia caucasica TaxID=637954 RepID=A0AAV2KS40_KNICA